MWETIPSIFSLDFPCKNNNTILFPLAREPNTGCAPPHPLMQINHPLVQRRHSITLTMDLAPHLQGCCTLHQSTWLQRLVALMVTYLTPPPQASYHSASHDLSYHSSFVSSTSWLFALHKWKLSALCNRWWLPPLTVPYKHIPSLMPPCKHASPTLGRSGPGGCASTTPPPLVMAN